MVNLLIIFLSTILICKAEVSFSELKEKVIAPKCLSCHKKWSDEDSFISKHVIPGDAENSKMYQMVRIGKMPKAPMNEDGSPGVFVPLNSYEMELIRNYINSLSANPSHNR